MSEVTTPGLLTDVKPAVPLYAVLNGPIDQDSAKKVVNNLTAATQKGFTEAHILFGTNGGSVSDGMFLHDFFKSFTLPATIYSAGSVQSSGVLVYLGVERRLAGKNSLFMIHRTTFAPPASTGKNLTNFADMARLEDIRTREILSEHIKLMPKHWDNLGDNQFWFSATEAVAYGLAHAVGEFSPPKGHALWSLTL